MSFTQEDLNQAARLAALHLSETESAALTEELASIMTMVDAIQAVNTDNVEPMAHPLDLKQRLRADVVNEKDARDELQQLSDHCDTGHYLVPNVIED